MAQSPFRTKVELISKETGMAHFLAEVKKLAKHPHIKVGVQGKQASEPKKKRLPNGKIVTSDKATLVRIAAIHEFGATYVNAAGTSVHIPERSFLRSTVSENVAEFKERAALYYKRIMTDKDFTTEEALGLLGEFMQAKVQDKFYNNNWDPLSTGVQNARKARGKNNTKFTGHRPLLDTLQLLRSIRYVRVMEHEGSGE